MKQTIKHLFQIALIITFVLSFGYLLAKQFVFEEATTIMLGDDVLHVLVAKTPEKRYKGLSNRTSLEEKDGMLFLFDTKYRYGFVMRDMRFPLDIIWIDEDGIVDIAYDLQPMPELSSDELPVFYPRQEALAVVEIPAGKARELDLKIGEPLRILE